ncbi:LacI family DNA-binding transcriptional regulator [Paenibacillus sp. IB182496]|uniref:LacI family DNA-binding transcriptional regulator n=1 Tax=Paenibacillus sabuli TaxID=2772509 RepID=A0A927BXB3_9BACL|nr:LacI family DNA-binding transcriptional regulator [Paenibacillus sabuli]MBD2847204.1 LacI family DNA-binding transcriptional regulator [Paenibacillus sabuli]
MQEEGLILRKEVAKLAGVSEATVSRVMNGARPVREATRRKVLEAAERLGYVPSALAQQFARKRSGNIGVIVPYVPKVRLFSTYYFSEILSGIGEAAQQRGYDMLLMFRSPYEARDYERLYRTRKVDACVMLGSQDTPGELEALARLAEADHPFVLVNQRFDGAPFGTVEADHEQGGYEATRHLLGRGCRRIALLNGPLVYSNSADRLTGYRRALAEAGLPADPGLCYAGNYSRTSGAAAAPALAEAIAQGRVDGVFAANDRMAIGLLQGLRERGLLPGADVALIGYDDSEAARLTEPQLSSVAVPFHALGVRAAQRLLGRTADGSPADDASPVLVEKLPVQLVARASSLTYTPSV